MPYRHPNHQNRYDQRQGQKKHKQASCDVKTEWRQNQQTEWKTNSSIQQIDQQKVWMKIKLGWTTSQMMQHFLLLNP